MPSRILVACRAHTLLHPHNDILHAHSILVRIFEPHFPPFVHLSFPPLCLTHTEFAGGLILGRVSTSVIAKGVADVGEFEEGYGPEAYAYGMVVALAVGGFWQMWASWAGYNVSATQSISECVRFCFLSFFSFVRRHCCCHVLAPPARCALCMLLFACIMC